jgi:hypothetical protein
VVFSYYAKDDKHSVSEIDAAIADCVKVQPMRLVGRDTFRTRAVHAGLHKMAEKSGLIDSRAREAVRGWLRGVATTRLVTSRGEMCEIWRTEWLWSAMVIGDSENNRSNPRFK